MAHQALRRQRTGVFRTAIAAVCAVATLTACGAGSTVTDARSADAPGATPDAPGVDAPIGPLPFDHQWQESDLCAVDGSPQPDCCTDARLELPATAASALDLRALASGAAGTCGDPVKLELPSDPAAYPLMVILPAVTDADPFCTKGCAGRGEPTAFGIVLELPQSLVDNYRPLIVAPPPWKYVYDHNSAAGDACLDGYQEFGERACVRPNYGGAIGFATGSTTTPSRTALIDLQPGPNGGVDTCCPYLPNLP